MVEMGVIPVLKFHLGKGGLDAWDAVRACWIAMLKAVPQPEPVSDRTTSNTDPSPKDNL
jgi:hypothetical protein